MKHSIHPAKIMTFILLVSVPCALAGAEKKTPIKVDKEKMELLGFSQLIVRRGKSINIGVAPENFNVVIVENLRRWGYNVASSIQ